MMRVVFLLLLLCFTAMSLPAQQGGMMPRWEVEALAKTLQTHAGEVKQLLEDVRPKEWIQDGAPHAYVEQYDKLLKELSNLDLSAQALERNPESLSRVVDTFLWLERVHSLVDSIVEGTRRYQTGPYAHLLAAARDRNAAAEQELKQYMQQLAVAIEERLDIAHSEAQRCRGLLARQPRGGD